MKNTPFTEKHIALGARMAPFAGYNMPISYTGINDEHQAVRTNAGVFDVSHMGEFILKGEKALDLIQRVTSNDASRLTAGKAQYSCLPNNEGGIVDDLLVYCMEENKVYMLVVNASNKVEQRQLETGDTYGDKWLVLSGLKAGDRLIVEGTDKVTPGQEVKAEEMKSSGGNA